MPSRQELQVDVPITVNGQTLPYQALTVRELLVARGINPERPGIAVALNARVVSRSNWEVERVQPGDRVEVIWALAGG